MRKRFILTILALMCLILPLTALGANIPARVFENGANNIPLTVPGVKIEVFGGFGFKALLSTTQSGTNGDCTLKNVPLGREVLVKMTKSGYVPQADVRSYSEADLSEGAILFTGSEANIAALYSSIGEAFDSGKSQAYLEIIDENTGEGIEGIQLSVSSGKAFDLGQGEYLVANAGGASLKLGISKPGYAFDIESATIPFFPGFMTQYFIKVQSSGGVYSHNEVGAVTSAAIAGQVVTYTGSIPVTGASVAFTSFTGGTVRPSVSTNFVGQYYQDGFQVGAVVIVKVKHPSWRLFIPPLAIVTVKEGINTKNFKAFGSMM